MHHPFWEWSNEQMWLRYMYFSVSRNSMVITNHILRPRSMHSRNCIYDDTRQLRCSHIICITSAGKSGRLDVPPRWCLNPLRLRAEPQMTGRCSFFSIFNNITICCLFHRNVIDFRWTSPLFSVYTAPIVMFFTYPRSSETINLAFLIAIFCTCACIS